MVVGAKIPKQGERRLWLVLVRKIREESEGRSPFVFGQRKALVAWGDRLVWEEGRRVAARVREKKGLWFLGFFVILFK
jgi:hypothetical protein